MKSPLSPIGDTIKASKWHVLAATAAFLAGIYALCTTNSTLAYIQLIFTDGYVALMFWSVAQMSAHRKNGKADPQAETWPGSPRRDAAVLVLALLLGAATTGFAALYTQSGWIVAGSLASQRDALYFSTVTVATVGYGDFHPLTDAAKTVVIAQIATGILFLAAAIPVLASRISEVD
jgi:Ion channel